MRFRKAFAIILCSILTLSFAGCANSNSNESSNSKTAETSVAQNSSESSEKTEVKLPELDIDPEMQKSFEEKIDMDKLGPLSKFAVQMMENKTLDVKFDIVQLTEDEESKSSKSPDTFDLNSISEEITAHIIKNENKDYRIKLDLGLFSFDLLKNKDGTFSVNKKTRSYQKLSDVSEASAKTSSDSSKEVENAMNSIKDMTNGMLDNIDTDSLIQDKGDKEVTYNGEGTETYKENEYKYESYTVKEKPSEKSSASGKTADNKEKNINVKVYFGDDNIMKIIHIEADKQKFDFVFNTFTTEIDPEDLVIPAEYEEKQQSSVDLSDLNISLPDISSSESR